MTEPTIAEHAMTELIVALDGPDPQSLLAKLRDAAEQRWFKVGPLTETSEYRGYQSLQIPNTRIFVDRKLADTRSTCEEFTRRMADRGIAAVSTSTLAATEAAMRGAEGSNLRVWRVIALTDENLPKIFPLLIGLGHGGICPYSVATEVERYGLAEIVVPGVRLELGAADQNGGHRFACTPQMASANGATHIVVGRPIWAAPDPVAACLAYRAALAAFSEKSDG